MSAPPDQLRHHQRRVWLSLLAMGLHPERARDIAQTAWLRLLEKHGAEGLDEAQLPGLAIAQARFLALDDLRRRKTELRALEQSELAAMGAVDALDPERRAISRAQVERALRELSLLHSSAQKAFLLVHGDPPKSQAETAAELGLSLQRVRQILSEVRQRLRPILEESET